MRILILLAALLPVEGFAAVDFSKLVKCETLAARPKLHLRIEREIAEAQLKGEDLSQIFFHGAVRLRKPMSTAQIMALFGGEPVEIRIVVSPDLVTLQSTLKGALAAVESEDIVQIVTSGPAYRQGD